MGQEHPRVLGDWTPGRPVFPMEGKTMQEWGVEDVPKDGLALGSKTKYGTGSRTSCISAPQSRMGSREAGVE